MKKINLYEMKTQFSKYIEIVVSGETVVVCKRNVPVAEIRPIAKTHKKTPELGWAKGMLTVPSNFKQSTEKELAQWYGDEKDPLRQFRPRSGRRQ